MLLANIITTYGCTQDSLLPQLLSSYLIFNFYSIFFPRNTGVVVHDVNLFFQTKIDIYPILISESNLCFFYTAQSSFEGEVDYFDSDYKTSGRYL